MVLNGTNAMIGHGRNIIFKRDRYAFHFTKKQCKASKYYILKA